MRFVSNIPCNGIADFWALQKPSLCWCFVLSFLAKHHSEDLEFGVFFGYEIQIFFFFF